MTRQSTSGEPFNFRRSTGVDKSRTNFDALPPYFLREDQDSLSTEWIKATNDAFTTDETQWNREWRQTAKALETKQRRKQMNHKPHEMVLWHWPINEYMKGSKLRHEITNNYQTMSRLNTMLGINDWYNASSTINKTNVLPPWRRPSPLQSKGKGRKDRILIE